MYPIGQGEPEASEIASEYNDIYILVGYENEVLQLLSKELKTLKIDQIKWRATLHNSHINRLLKTTFNYQPAATSARYIIKRDCWSFERLSKNTRDRYKRSVRQLNKVNATFQWIAAADFEHYAGRLAQFHQARWNKIGHAGAFAESDFNAFHKNYRTNHPNHINISAIVVDNQPIAINYYLADKTTLYFYQCGWDESNYAKFSPGFALHIWSIEHCKLEYYDFMMGGLNDSYKAKFGCKKIPMANNHVILTKWKFHVNRLINKITKYLKP
ncbi:GNAT family N-acetyltransferase [Colwellia chukchiensis]|uniref:GNAT family N-acetyltransferase n=1 Tax=Colwellia chukchiensis TaxID=641665 RepID=UPI001301EF6C|nr:GNAT family N-acetyltransferase [Colwellia chukchiensis]